jgi:hypothetical protein
VLGNFLFFRCARPPGGRGGARALRPLAAPPAPRRPAGPAPPRPLPAACAAPPLGPSVSTAPPPPPPRPLTLTLDPSPSPSTPHPYPRPLTPTPNPPPQTTRMHNLRDLYFVGGFGTVQWIDVDEYLGATPDAIATNAPQRTLKARGARGRGRGRGRLGCAARMRPPGWVRPPREARRSILVATSLSSPCLASTPPPHTHPAGAQRPVRLGPCAPPGP